MRKPWPIRALFIFASGFIAALGLTLAVMAFAVHQTLEDLLWTWGCIAAEALIFNAAVTEWRKCDG